MAKSKYEAQLLSWAVQQAVELHKGGDITASDVIEEAKIFSDACYSPERDFETVVAELAELFKSVPDPLAKANQLLLELNHMIEDIERQEAAHKALTETKGDA